jgi:glycosyltransferase involved in cell wall biosynthesis
MDDIKLLMINGGSSDQTAAVASQIEGVRLIRHQQNRGYGATVMAFSLSFLL